MKNLDPDYTAMVIGTYILGGHRARRLGESRKEKGLFTGWGRLTARSRPDGSRCVATGREHEPIAKRTCGRPGHDYAAEVKRSSRRPETAEEVAAAKSEALSS